MIRGIKFACVPVRDQDQSLKFFTEKLGFRVMTDQPFGEISAGSNLVFRGLTRNLFCSLPKAMKIALADFSRSHSGPTMCSPPPRF